MHDLAWIQSSRRCLVLASASTAEIRRAMQATLIPTIHPQRHPEINLTLTCFYSSSSRNGGGGGYSNGYSNGGGGSYGGGSYGGGYGGRGGGGAGAGDRMSNLGAGLKKQDWGKSNLPEMMPSLSVSLFSGMMLTLPLYRSGFPSQV